MRRSRSWTVLPALLLLPALLAAALPASAAPPRPALMDRLRLIRSHPRLPVRVEPPPLPAGGQEDVDVLSYELTIIPSVWEKRIEGTVAITFTPAPGVAEARELVLDLAENMFVSLGGITRRSSGHILPHRREGDVLRVDLALGGFPVPSGQTETVQVRWSGHPAQDLGGGLIFSTFGRFPNHVPSMFSLSQPYLARTWWPCKDRPDDKATVTVRIDAPAQWEAVSNGTFAGITAGSRDGSQVTAWRERVPIPTYAVAVALSDYETCEAEYVSPLDPAVRTPLTFWAWPSRLDAACSNWSSTPEIMAAMAHRFGEYPFASEKYGHVAIAPRTNPFVAMENATCTFIGSSWLNLSHDLLIAHELAHHWWGNGVTPSDFGSLWLSEGFATYAEALWWEHQNGHSEYRGYMSDLDTLRTMGEFEGTVDQPIDLDGNGWPDGDASGAELTVYNKGAWVLHMLRWVMGQQDLGASPERMDRLFRAWGSARPQGNGVTADFVTLADALAADEFEMREGLEWFFEQWLHREGRPCYRVGWSAVPGMDGGWSLHLVVDQAARGLDEDLGVTTCADDLAEPYRMPVRVLVHLESGERTAFTVDSRGSGDAWSITLPQRPVGVTWDPDGWILKDVQSVDADADDDGWADPFDLCPLVPDASQRDLDRDGRGDACQEGIDFDGDGTPNEGDCAPADPEVWTGAERLPPILLLTAKSENGLLVGHLMPEPSGTGERRHVVDIAQGRLERLRANGSFRDASCVEAGRTVSGELTIPWTELEGNRYVVLLPWNGCGPTDASGRLDDPCR